MGGAYDPIFNHLFKDDAEGPHFKIETFKEVIADYADRITTPVLIGIRAGYLKNEAEVRALDGWHLVKSATDAKGTAMEKPSEKPSKEKPSEGQSVEVRVMTPLEAAKSIGEKLP